MINNVSVIEHDKLILYSLDDFAMDEDLQECIRNAKVEAISLKNASCQVKEIGNGSANNTSVFCIPNPDISGEKLALKLVSYITTTYPPEYEADEAVRDLVNNTPKSNRVIDEIINSLKTKDCRNVIPLSGHDTIIWKCPKYNRIGIDYALKMPLAACINDTISKYVVRHNTGTNALLTEEKPETEKTILEIGIDLCIALQDLHAHGIIHRDIKPGNIFLYKEHYCLGDFGIAVENPSSQDFRVGTQDYWAPEQAGDMFSDKYDHRMDIYSLGLVLYELADTMSVSMHYRDRMKGQSLPDLSSVSKGLNKILHKACQFDPDNRYQNAEAFWADLHLLQNKHDYIPVYQAPEESHEYATSKNKSAGTPSNTAYSSSQKRNPYGRKQARKKLEDFIISPETVWNAGKFWYDESCKRGNRFSGFDIDRRIMPLSVTSNHVIDGSYMFSPDSRYFIFKPFALSSRCHIELWSTDTCKFIKKIVGYDYSNHVAFSPDEKYILTIDSLCQLKLFAFDKVTGSTSLIHDTEIKHILNYEIPTMTCIQFVCNGKYVLMGDNYGNLFLCDFETILTSPKNIEKHCWILSGHHDSINSISEYIYNDAHYAITSSSDCKVKIWNLQTKKCISLLHKGNISSTLSACYILNGKYIVVSGNSRELLIFDPLTGKYVDRIGTTDNYTWKYTWKVSYHAETKQLAVVLDNGSVALYRYQNNTFVHQKTVKMMDEYIGELKFSPKGDKLLTISYIGNILCIYNILSEKLITLDKVNSIHKSDAFAYLDTDTSGTPPNYDDTVVKVTTAPGKAVQTSRNYTFRGNGTFSYPDGDTVLASFQNADSIGYFDSATGKFKGINHAYYEPYRKNIMHKLYKKSQDFPWSIGMRQVDSIAYNRDGTYLFITRHGGRVEIWSTFTGKCLAILKAFNADAKKLAVSDDGDYIAFSTCGPNIKIYRMCDIHTTDSFDLCYSDNITDWKCKYNIRGEWRFQVRKSANKLYHFIYKTQEGHKQPIAGMEFSPDKKQLLTTAYDRSVKIWDLSDASRDQYNISPHCLYSIEFIPGLKVKGAVIQNLHSSSNLTDKELESLKTYGAIL